MYFAFHLLYFRSLPYKYLYAYNTYVITRFQFAVLASLVSVLPLLPVLVNFHYAPSHFFAGECNVYYVLDVNSPGVYLVPGFYAGSFVVTDSNGFIVPYFVARDPLPDWNYRIPVHVSGDALFIFIPLDFNSLVSSGYLRPDLADIRVVTPSGTFLPIYVDPLRGGIFVRRSSPSESTLYVYFGNPDANSVSDPSIFIYYDNDFSAWKATSSRVVYDVDSSDGLPAPSLVARKASDRRGGAYVPVSLPDSFVVDLYFRRDSRSGCEFISALDSSGGGVGAGVCTSNRMYVFNRIRYTSRYRIRSRTIRHPRGWFRLIFTVTPDSIELNVGGTTLTRTRMRDYNFSQLYISGGSIFHADSLLVYPAGDYSVSLGSIETPPRGLVLDLNTPGRYYIFADCNSTYPSPFSFSEYNTASPVGPYDVNVTDAPVQLSVEGNVVHLSIPGYFVCNGVPAYNELNLELNLPADINCYDMLWYYPFSLTVSPPESSASSDLDISVGSSGASESSSQSADSSYKLSRLTSTAVVLAATSSAAAATSSMYLLLVVPLFTFSFAWMVYPYLFRLL